MGGGEDVLSLACFLISTSTLCVDLNLVVGIFFLISYTSQFILSSINEEALLIGQKMSSEESKISRNRYSMSW